jgi:hypothetical protein
MPRLEAVIARDHLRSRISIMSHPDLRAAPAYRARNGIGVHFALRDMTTLRLEDIFDRILQADDVPPLRFTCSISAARVVICRFRPNRSRDKPVLVTRKQLQVLGKPSSSIVRTLVLMRETRSTPSCDARARQPDPWQANRHHTLRECLRASEGIHPQVRGFIRAKHSRSGQIGCRVPCKRQIGGALPRDEYRRTRLLADCEILVDG